MPPAPAGSFAMDGGRPTMELPPLSARAARSLRRVVVVHRHGVRLPTKPTPPLETSFPHDPAFWRVAAGHLPPKGVSQLRRLGAELRKRYQEAGALRYGIHNDGIVVGAYSSLVQRTLQSSWAFFEGFAPETPVITGSLTDAEGLASRARRAGAVPLFLEGTSPREARLFHGWWEAGSEYSGWLRANQARSARLRALCSDADTAVLLDKLYALTGDPKVSPRLPALQRVLAARRLDTLAEIGEVLGVPTFATILPASGSADSGGGLTAEERRLLACMAREAKRCWFHDAGTFEEPPSVARSYGGRAAGHLGSFIARLLDPKTADLVIAPVEVLAAKTADPCVAARGSCDAAASPTPATASATFAAPRFFELSCHDRTLAALAALLGVDVSTYGFAAHFVFECHEDRDELGGASREGVGPLVRLYYNADPFRGSALGEYRIPPLSRSPWIVAWENLQQGCFPLSEFAEHCRRGVVPPILPAPAGSQPRARL